MDRLRAETDGEQRKCRIVELIQFECSQKTGDKQQIYCVPIPRVFRMSVINFYAPVEAKLTKQYALSLLSRCGERPAVEITKFVNIDPTTGAVDVPPEARLAHLHLDPT